MAIPKRPERIDAIEGVFHGSEAGSLKAPTAESGSSRVAFYRTIITAENAEN